MQTKGCVITSQDSIATLLKLWLVHPASGGGQPGTSGRQPLRRLAGAPLSYSSRRVRTVMVPTASRAVSHDVRYCLAMRAGACQFLEKPLRLHELWQSIQEAIRLDEKNWSIGSSWPGKHRNRVLKCGGAAGIRPPRDRQDQQDDRRGT